MFNCSMILHFSKRNYKVSHHTVRKVVSIYQSLKYYLHLNFALYCLSPSVMEYFEEVEFQHFFSDY